MTEWIEELPLLRQIEFAMAAMAFGYVMYATTVFLVLILKA